MPARGRWSAGGRRGRGRAEGDGIAMSRTTVGGSAVDGWGWRRRCCSRSRVAARPACVCVCVSVGVDQEQAWVVVGCWSRAGDVGRSVGASQRRTSQGNRHTQKMPDACQMRAKCQMQMPNAKMALLQCARRDGRRAADGSAARVRGGEIWSPGLEPGTCRCREAQMQRCQVPRAAPKCAKPGDDPKATCLQASRAGIWDSAFWILGFGPGNGTAEPGTFFTARATLPRCEALLCRSSLGCWPVSTQPTKAHQNPPWCFNNASTTKSAVHTTTPPDQGPGNTRPGLPVSYTHLTLPTTERV